MIVFIGGMPRSGSTFSFNVVRDLLQRRGSIYYEPTTSVLPLLNRSGTADHLIFKAHEADFATLRLIELGAIKAVCTMRKPEDAIASWMETFGFSLERSIIDMENWLKIFARLHPHSMLLTYEELDTDAISAAVRIAKYLRLEAEREEIIETATWNSKTNIKSIVDKMCPTDEAIQPLEFSYYDVRSLYHRRHVSSIVSRPAKDRIGEGSVVAIRQRLSSYLNSDGYINVVQKAM